MLLRTFISGLACVTISSVSAQAASSDVPPSVKIDSKELKLIGSGIRTASWLKVKVYQAALYSADPKQPPLELQSSSLPEVIDMTFLRSIKAKDSRTAWQDSLAHVCEGKTDERNCCKSCQPSAEVVKQFLDDLIDIKDGDKYRYIFYENRVEVVLPDQSQKNYSDPRIAQALLATWIGDHPPTAELKHALTGK
jgi:hypothetical protein